MSVVCQCVRETGSFTGEIWPLNRFADSVHGSHHRDQGPTRRAEHSQCFVFRMDQPSGQVRRMWCLTARVWRTQNEETTEIYLLNISWIFIDHIDQRTSGNPLASPLVVEVYSDFAKHLKGFNFDPALGRQDWCNLCNLLGLHKRVLCQLLTFLRMSWDAMSFLDLWGSPLVCFFSSECSQYFGKAMDQAVPPRYGSTELGGVGTSAMLGYGDMPPVPPIPSGCPRHAQQSGAAAEGEFLRKLRSKKWKFSRGKYGESHMEGTNGFSWWAWWSVCILLVLEC
jgi:hypothetical protein